LVDDPDPDPLMRNQWRLVDWFWRKRLGGGYDRLMIETTHSSWRSGDVADVQEKIRVGG
jgi:hypothetical protein